MSLIVIPYIFSSGTTIVASQTNSNNSTIVTVINGGLDNTNLTGSAGITYANLALGGNIVNADINAAAAIANTKLNLASITGTINIGTASAGRVFYDNGTSIVGLAAGSSGQILKSGGTSAPSWTQIGFVPNNIQVFTSSGTWTQPAGVTNVYVKVIGAGGSVTSNGTAGAGGGGYAEGVIAVTGNVTVTIGSTNSFAGTTTIQATAGTSLSNTAFGVAGGMGSGGSINLAGESGSPNGKGGSSAMGFGGVMLFTSGTPPGVAGSPYGGGGSASLNGSTTGGTGDPGAVIVYY